MSKKYKLRLEIKDTERKYWYPRYIDVKTTGRWKIVTTYSGTVDLYEVLYVEVEYQELGTFPSFKKEFPFVYMKEYMIEKHTVWKSETDLYIVEVLNNKDSKIFTCDGEG